MRNREINPETFMGARVRPDHQGIQTLLNQWERAYENSKKYDDPKTKEEFAQIDAKVKRLVFFVSQLLDGGVTATVVEHTENIPTPISR